MKYLIGVHEKNRQAAHATLPTTERVSFTARGQNREKWPRGVSISNSKIHGYRYREQQRAHASAARWQIAHQRSASRLSINIKPGHASPLVGNPRGAESTLHSRWCSPTSPETRVLCDIPRHNPNRRYKWRLWTSKEIYCRSISKPSVRCHVIPLCDETELLIRHFSARSLIRLIRGCITQLEPVSIRCAN